ncbi:type IV pilin [Halorubrum salsamenti]|uniref:type IV pilin n=1 Tax=Halorubrum salsamenti TaxID=2583990 RepID=UPI00119DB635|nr:type IV pilin N-terminal domain-containing protein [Halorubrum salsamenti]
MKPTNQSNAEDRAVSPVIGVILMVAITVILAAVIGTFVLGLGDQLGDTAPQASFTVETVNNSSITIAKTAGQDIDKSDLTLSVNGDRQDAETFSGNSTWKSGASKSIPHGVSNGTDGATVRLIHDPSGSAIYQDTVDIPA